MQMALNCVHCTLRCAKQWSQLFRDYFCLPAVLFIFMWAFFSSMTNKIILEFQSWRHHLNCIGFLYWNQFCLNPNQVEKWHLPQGVSQRTAWMLALVGSQEKTIQLSLFQLSTFTTKRLGSQEKNNPPPTFTFSWQKQSQRDESFLFFRLSPCSV